MKAFILIFIEIILGIIFCFYLYLFAYRNQIETSITFAGLGMSDEYDYEADGFEEIHITDKNGNHIHGIFLDNKKQKTIFYFHGNGASLGNYIDDIKYLANLGYNVMSYDYPGYGKSTGYPLEENVYEFTRAFFEYIQEKKGVQTKDIISFGHSIGTALATDFSYTYKPQKTILISPLCSRYEMSIEKYGFVLQKILFMKNSFNSCQKVKEISSPLLVIHGNHDEVIPYSHGKKVFKNAKSTQKFFITLENFGHNGIFEIFGNELQKPIKEFLEKGNLEKTEITIQ